ncbi:beta family protein [Komagataeibacter intermedius]|uniref:Beta protein n=2 Tax=Komagataeibacter intermedius TaxID=66229 RepID=A0A0N1N641_9PROT|nr:beta family protein [Komagataeibacter intermedius]KPH86240.1 hypothetical protein GLUCOINTEAF2_0202855 [Komagataeibacter intermedius AF2]MCF3637248.1 beta family protein [Komagataeibacter intermedius]GAN87832.1 hypothetical protein Gain_0098_004 [Komagataeibacter intermedius TF2]GBQ72934.1 hypothetical protein AA0521_2234 [Komagataeibacter intermedius NRIC 0521]
MILTKEMYVPALRWRLGEYQALNRLTDVAKDLIVPYITIPEVEFDFELWKPKKSIQEHVEPFPDRFKTKWGHRPAWITVHPEILGKPMDSGQDIFTYIFENLRAYETNAVPALPLDAPLAIISVVRDIIAIDQLGVAITVRMEDLMKPDARLRVETLCSKLGISLEETDLVIDLGSPNFEPYRAFAGAMTVALQRFGDLEIFRNFTIISTAIPETFKDVARGADQLVRHDWLFYQTLITTLPTHMRRPNYGDYAIVNPNFAPVDMRKIKASGKLVYTTPKTWEIRKGGAFRDHPEQMHDHCASIVASGEFSGSAFSSGDDYIYKCALRTKGHSNQTRWKEVAISHHIMQVLNDLATFGAGP